MEPTTDIPASLERRLVRYEDRDAWLEARSVEHRIGGSDVGAILGVSSFAGPWDVYLNRHRLEAPPEQNEDQARGHLLEPAILGLYEKLYDRKVIDLGFCHVVHPEHPWAVASLDGLCWDPEAQTLGAVDAKSHYDWDQPKTDAEITEYGAESVIELAPYEANQGYWYLEITGLPWIDFAVYLPGRECHEVEFGGVKYMLTWCRMRTVRLHAVPKLQKTLLKAVGAWRQRHLVDKEEPPVDATRACTRGVAREMREDYAVATEDQVQLILEAHAAREERKAAAAKELLAKNTLFKAMGEAKVLAIQKGWHASRTTNNRLNFKGF